MMFLHILGEIIPIENYKGVKLISLPSISTKNLDAISHTFLATLHALFCKYDVIHYHAIGPSSLCWIIKWFKPKTALVATFHCQDYYHQKWGKIAQKYLKFSEKIACSVPHLTITVSNKLWRYTKKKYYGQAIMIPNGAEVKTIQGTDKLAQWKIKEKKYILFVGRLIKHKGVHYLIEAFKKLEDTGKIPNGFKLVIVGDGFHTDEYVNYLKIIAQKRENIIFTGSQSGETLAQLFANAYMFVQPSEYEGLSIALLEAMGYGLPVLVSDIDENLEVVGKTGMSFGNKDIDDLKQKIAYLLNRPEEGERLGRMAKEKIMNEFSWDIITKKTLKAYSDVIRRF